MIELPRNAMFRPGPELLAMGFNLSPIGGRKRGVRIRETHNEGPWRENVTKSNSVAVLKAELKELGKQTDALVGALDALLGKDLSAKKGRPKGSKNKKKAETTDVAEAGPLESSHQPRKSRAKKEEKQPVEA